MKAARRKPRRARYLPELFLSGLLVAVGFVPSACLLPEVELVDQLGSGGGADAKPSSGGRASMGGASTMGGKSSVGGWGGRDGSFGGRENMPGPGIEECNWSSGRCDDLACASACPTNDGDYCRSACQGVIDCITRNPSCQTLTDPVCALRSATGRPNECTAAWENATGDATNAPGKVALAYVNCVCEL